MENKPILEPSFTSRCDIGATIYSADDVVGTAIDTARSSCVELLGGSCGIRVQETSRLGPSRVEAVITTGCSTPKDNNCGNRALALLNTIEVNFPYVGKS